MNEIVGVVYILTNPSFPEYVKIGYTNDINKRLHDLNKSECIPYAFRLYAYYEVSIRLTDKKIHEIIDGLNPTLRAIDNFEGKERKREFYAISPETAYSLLNAIASMHGFTDRLHLVTPTECEKEKEKEANENRQLAHNRHHLKDIQFFSSLTNRNYYSRTKENGNLGIYDAETEEEIESYSNPSKKQILKQAVKDLGGDVSQNKTSYELQHQLEKLILNQ